MAGASPPEVAAFDAEEDAERAEGPQELGLRERILQLAVPRTWRAEADDPPGVQLLRDCMPHLASAKEAALWR